MRIFKMSKDSPKANDHAFHAIVGAYAMGVSLTCTNEDESSGSMSSTVKHCQARRKLRNGFQVDLKIIMNVNNL
jgi:hypothetical protein